MQARIGAQTVSVSVVKRPRQVQVCVADSLEIPACSEALLKCAVHGLYGTVLVEPKYEITSKDSSLYPARCVANTVDGAIPIKIANPNSFPVTVFAGTCVAMAESLDKIDQQSNDGKSNPSTSSSCLDDVDIANCDISQQEETRLFELLKEYEDVFVSSETDLRRAERFSHNIETVDHPPIRQRPYRIPHSQLDMVDRHIENMLEKGVIQESNSPWSQSLVIVTKKDGSPRFCVDFRKLNSITKIQIFPMPRVDEVLDTLGDACYFTTLDLASGYWQIQLNPKDKLINEYNHQGISLFSQDEFTE